MAKAKKSRKRFKGAVGRNAAKQTRGAQYGHLNLPKGLKIYKEEPKSRVSIDIMPYIVSSKNHPDRDDEYAIAVPGELWYKLPYWLHRNIGANKDSVVCLSSIKQKCPICEYRKQLLKDGAMWDDDAVKALKPSMRNLYVVIPKGSKDYSETPHIWDISQFLFQEKLNEEIQENEEYETFPDLEDGYTLKIRFTENQLGTNKFAETSRIDFMDREDVYEEGILDEIPTLDDILIVPTYKVIETLFFGELNQDEIDDDEDEDEDDRKPKVKRARPKVDDDDEDDDEDEDEDDRKPKVKRARPKVDDDEDDDEDEDAPGRSKTTKTKSTVKPKSTSSKKKVEKNQCPHGYKFGTDCEEYDECDACDKWEDCIDAE